MRLLAIALAGLILLIQYPLWLGKGGLLRVWEMERQIESQQQINTGLQARNAALDAEVRDLKQGLDAVEERARNELGMIRRDEILFQVLEAAPTGAAAAAPVPALAPAPAPAKK